ncbi:leucine-rich repeat-containing protein 56 isoform X3 [Erinaceus europaeus]|uniref:Leucine-rich repeat-containing protein 56 isoform X3 n=1 Tax=Erinaceus europaeus TaxID=9365 RepID=A0ABM3W5K2_ERIEU|nr:leucine-rich repeat-containing protein 56 isoform X3 [Erinaceus europaeus]
MSDPCWEKAAACRRLENGPGQSRRPGTASVRVWELSGQGQRNPCPQSRDPGDHRGDHGESLLEECLSPTRLIWGFTDTPRPSRPCQALSLVCGGTWQALARGDDLALVRTLEMTVDTRENSLGSFALHLPSLRELKLNGSRLGSVRDLGTSLGRLQVLWVARCGLRDLDGIGSLPALKELYASYNDIAELSPLCQLEALEALDLEGNSVEDLGQVQYLRLCPRLAALTLDGNPVSLQPGPAHQGPGDCSYRVELRRLLPQLRVLDDVPAAHTGCPGPLELGRDRLLVKEAIKACGLDGHYAGLDAPRGAPLQRPAPPPSPLEPQSWAPWLWPLSQGLHSKDQVAEDDTSNLTHGASRVLCGNPTRGLWERRQQSQARVSREPSPHWPEALTSVSTGDLDPAVGPELPAGTPLPALREPCLGQVHPTPLSAGPARYPGSQQPGASVLQSPRRGPKEKETARATTSPSPPRLTPEPSGTPSCALTPSPPRLPMPPGLGSSSRGPLQLQFRGRRLRALGSLGPGLGQGLAAVATLRALALGSDPEPGPDPAARPPGLGCMPHLNPITPAHR